MKVSARGWFVLGTFAAVVALLLLLFLSSPSSARSAEPVRVPAGGLTEQSLGSTLQSLGLVVKKDQQRYDFQFRAMHGGEEWRLSMSAVLSQNGESVWIMAWLDELPKSAADVPRTALLRLLAANDRLGSGKFFAYIATNRRFVLQRVIDNKHLGKLELQNALKDLGSSVVETHPYWATANWNPPATAPTQTAKSAALKQGTIGRPPIRSAIRDSKFRPTRRQ